MNVDVDFPGVFPPFQAVSRIFVHFILKGSGIRLPPDRGPNEMTRENPLKFCRKPPTG